MKKLTENQQHLINQITEEFIRHNRASEYAITESLLGIHDMMDEVNRKQKEIARVMAHNESVHKAMEPILDDHYEALAHEINALGLKISQGTIYSHLCGTRCKNITIADSIHVQVQLRGDTVNFEGTGCLPNQLAQLDTRAHYKWSDYYGWMSFGQMCESESFRETIKKLYEQNQIKK